MKIGQLIKDRFQCVKYRVMNMQIKKKNNLMSVKIEGLFNFQMRAVIRMGDWFYLIFNKRKL